MLNQGPSPDLLSRARTWSYAMGYWQLAWTLSLAIFISPIIIFSGWEIQLLLPLNIYMYAGLSTAFLESDVVRVLVMNPAGNVVSAIATLFWTLTSIGFGYCIYRIGRFYNLNSLMVAGTLNLIVAMSFPFLLYAIYQFYASALLTTGGSSQIFAAGYILGANEVLGVLYAAGWIALIIGLPRIANKTHVDGFNTARSLLIAGIVIALLGFVGIVLFGRGIAQLMIQGRQMNQTLSNRQNPKS
jgi:hypothetical protein